MLMRATVALAAGLLLAGCGRPVVFHTSDAYPQHLSEWQVVWRDGDALRLNDGVMVYDIATPLFTDFADLAIELGRGGYSTARVVHRLHQAGLVDA